MHNQAEAGHKKINSKVLTFSQIYTSMTPKLISLDKEIINWRLTSINSSKTGKFSDFVNSCSHLFKIPHPPVVRNLKYIDGNFRNAIV